MLADLAFHLAQAGHQVKVVAANGLYDNPSANMPARENIRGVDVHRVYRPLFGRKNLLGRALDYLFMYAAFARAILRLADKGDIVIAKTDPPLLAIALLPVARWRGAKFVNWLQDLYPEVAVASGMRSIALLSPAITPLRNLTLSRADATVAIGARMRQRLAGAGAPDSRLHVIPNWCDDERIWPDDESIGELRRAWGLDGRFVVAYSGNLGRAHDYQTLVQAASRLNDLPDLTFLFIGGGALTRKLKVDVRLRGLEQKFAFQPYQPADTLPRSLNLPDVYWMSLLPDMEGLIVPSKFYGQCAAGKATIFVGDPDGEIARVIDEYNCGVCAEVGDSQRFAQIIRDLRRVPDRLKGMGANARRTLEQKFSRQGAFASWKKIIDEI